MKKGFFDQPKKIKKNKKKKDEESDATPSQPPSSSTSSPPPPRPTHLPAPSTGEPWEPQFQECFRLIRQASSHEARYAAFTSLQHLLDSHSKDIALIQRILDNLDVDLCNDMFLPIRQGPLRPDACDLDLDIGYGAVYISTIMMLFISIEKYVSLTGNTALISLIDVFFKIVGKGGVVRCLSPFDNYDNLVAPDQCRRSDSIDVTQAIHFLSVMLGSDEIIEISDEKSLIFKKVAREGYLNDLADGIQRLAATVRGGTVVSVSLSPDEGEEGEGKVLLELKCLDTAVRLGISIVLDLETIMGRPLDRLYPKQAMKMIDAATAAFGLLADVAQLNMMMVVVSLESLTPVPITNLESVVRSCADLQFEVQSLLSLLFTSKFGPQMEALVRKRTKWTKYLRNGAGMMLRGKNLPIFRRQSLCILLKKMFDLHKERGILGDPGVRGGPPTGMVFFKILVEITRIEIGNNLKDALAPAGTMVESVEHPSLKMTALDRAYKCCGLYYTILDDCIDALALCASNDDDDDNGGDGDGEYRLPSDVAQRAMLMIHDTILAILDFIETALFDDTAYTSPHPAASNKLTFTGGPGTNAPWIVKSPPMDDSVKRNFILIGAVKALGYYTAENPEPLAERIVPLLPLLLSIKCVDEWRAEINTNYIERESWDGWTEIPEGIKYFQDTLYGIAGAIEPYCWDEYKTRVFHEDGEEKGSGKKRRRNKKGWNADSGLVDKEDVDLSDFFEIECSEEVKDVWMKGMLAPAAFSCITDCLEILGRASRGTGLFRSMAALVYRLVSYPGFDSVASDAVAEEEEKEEEGASSSSSNNNKKMSLSPHLSVSLKAVRPLLEYATAYQMEEMADATVMYVVHNDIDAIDAISAGTYFLRFGFAASFILKKAFLHLDDEDGSSENGERADVIYKHAGVTKDFIARKLLLLMEAFCKNFLSLFYFRFTRGSFAPVEVHLASAVKLNVARCAEHCMEIAKKDKRFLSEFGKSSWLVDDVAGFGGVTRETRKQGYPDELVKFAVFCKKEGS